MALGPTQAGRSWIFRDWIAGCLEASGLGRVSLESTAQLGRLDWRLDGSDLWPRRVIRTRGAGRPELTKLVDAVVMWRLARRSWGLITAKWMQSACIAVGGGRMASVAGSTRALACIPGIPYTDPSERLREGVVHGLAVHAILNQSSRRRRVYDVAAIARFVRMTCLAQAVVPDFAPKLARALRRELAKAEAARCNDTPPLAKRTPTFPAPTLIAGDGTAVRLRLSAFRRSGARVELHGPTGVVLSMDAGSDQEAEALRWLLVGAQSIVVGSPHQRRTSRKK